MVPPRVRELTPVVMALASAELGVRLLSPRRRAAEPAAVSASDYFTAAEIARGARFARPQLALALLREATQIGVLAALTAGAPRAVPVRPRRRRSRKRPSLADEVRASALNAAGTSGAMVVARLPLAVIGRRRAMAVGLDTQSWSGWAADVSKAFALGGALAAGAGGAVTALIRRYPRGWWAPAAGASVVATGVFGALAPVLLEPLFNDFTPLPDGEARSDVLALAHAAGVKVGDVLSVDASRRTSGANAYVSGVGPTKRVVLFDTLLDRYSREELRVVVAHELSHVRHRDVVRSVALAAITAPASALAVQRLTWALSGEDGGSQPIPALALAAALVSAPVGVVAARLSRAVERRADGDALELSGAPAGFISMQQSLVRQNVSDVEPPWWVRLLLASHPPPLERIGVAVAYRDRASDGAAAVAAGASS